MSGPTKIEVSNGAKNPCGSAKRFRHLEIYNIACVWAFVDGDESIENRDSRFWDLSELMFLDPDGADRQIDEIFRLSRELIRS